MYPLRKRDLESLRNNESIVIKLSDKGGNVHMENHFYKSMCLKILNNKDWYRPIPAKFTDQFNMQIYIIVDQANEGSTISKELYPRVATFYSLPKIYKNPVSPTG